MKLTQKNLDKFFDNHPKRKEVETFDMNYREPIVRMLKDCVGENNDYIVCLQDADKVINYVLSRYTNLNSRKTNLQAIIWFIDHYPSLAKNVPREKYITAWEEAKLVANSKSKEYSNVSIDEIQTAVDKKYGPSSIESLYISFYKEVPLRLDFKDIQVYQKPKDIDPKQDKYFVYSTRQYVNKSVNKTKVAVDTILSEELTTKIKNSMIKHPRDELFVFKNNNNSKAISGLLTGAGFPKGTSLNNIRHAMSNTAVTPKEKVELAKKMGHAPATSENYRKQVNKNGTVSIDVPLELIDAVEKMILDHKKAV